MRSEVALVALQERLGGDEVPPTALRLVALKEFLASAPDGIHRQTSRETRPMVVVANEASPPSSGRPGYGTASYQPRW